MKLNKSQVIAIIKETVKDVLMTEGTFEEPPELKKARMAGRKKAREKMVGKTVEELKAAYLKIEAQANRESDEVKNAFLWGVCDMIRDTLKKQGEELPKANSDPWTR